MMDDVLRQAKDALVTPLAKSIGNQFDPITVTLLAGGVGVCAALAGWQGYYTLGLLLWWTNRFLDGLDGAVARLCRKQTALGGYLDMLIDFAMYTVIPLGLTLQQPSIPLLLALAFLFGTFYINAVAFLYLSALLEQHNQGAKQRGALTSIQMPKGIIEGTETIFFFSLFFLLPEQLLSLFIVLGVLVLATSGKHLIWSIRHLPHLEEQS